MLIKWITGCERTIQRTIARDFSDKYAKKWEDYQAQRSSSTAHPESAGNRPSQDRQTLGSPSFPSHTYSRPMTMTSGYGPDTVLAISLSQCWGKWWLCIGYSSLGQMLEPHRDEHLLKPMAGLGRSSLMPCRWPGIVDASTCSPSLFKAWPK